MQIDEKLTKVLVSGENWDQNKEFFTIFFFFNKNPKNVKEKKTQKKPHKKPANFAKKSKKGTKNSQSKRGGGRPQPPQTQSKGPEAEKCVKPEEEIKSTKQTAAVHILEMGVGVYTSKNCSPKNDPISPPESFSKSIWLPPSIAKKSFVNLA